MSDFQAGKIDTSDWAGFEEIFSLPEGVVFNAKGNEIVDSKLGIVTAEFIRPLNS